jgi:hypothetical protein
MLAKAGIHRQVAGHCNGPFTTMDAGLRQHDKYR